MTPILPVIQAAQTPALKSQTAGKILILDRKTAVGLAAAATDLRPAPGLEYTAGVVIVLRGPSGGNAAFFVTATLLPMESQ